jgi:hypothetical protein
MIYYTNRNKSRRYTLAEEDWLNKMISSKPEVIAIMHPDWRGIRSSTENLFDQCFYIGDSHQDFENVELYASLIIETGCKKIVFSGFPRTYVTLTEKIKRMDSSIKIYCLWHGSFLQSNEEYNWEQFKVILNMTKNKIIYKFGFVKEGMAEIMAEKFGIDTAFIKNYVKHIPSGPSPTDANINKIGLWAVSPNWRKNPYAMLVACSLVKNSKTFCFGHDNKVMDFINVFGINAYCQQEPIPQNEMPTILSQMHINLYVTLSECTPMTPLESLSAGVPCLVGPTSHLFRENEFLFERLVVPFPDKASYIRKHIEICLKDRTEIIMHYIKYAKEYQIQAKSSIINFLK